MVHREVPKGGNVNPPAGSPRHRLKTRPGRPHENTLHSQANSPFGQRQQARSDV
jgi:hypothetical protein